MATNDDYVPRVGDQCHWLDDGPDVYVVVDKARERTGGGRPMCLVRGPLNNTDQGIRRALPSSLWPTVAGRLRRRSRR